ncbi:MAG: hypothetical protein NUV86_07340 [Candidatus Scalindua sp.]|nr:hypothetical protein [Candidatus Scalindua sp.]
MIIRPRLNDYYDLPFTQEEVNFAIPFLNEDIPLYLDPFLLWKSPSQQDNALHSTITNTFNYLGHLFQKNEKSAIEILKNISECDEVGLGNSKVKHGKRIGDKLAQSILSTFKDIPQIQKQGFFHFEEIQLLVDSFSKDRVSDIACNFIKSYLIDFTIQKCKEYKIPMEKIKVEYFDTKTYKFVSEKTFLPINPETKEHIVLIPKRWLRFVPWFNFEDYFKNYISTSEKLLQGKPISRVEILEFNRKNYGVIQTYIKQKELQQKDCKNDPLFSQIPVLSSKRKKNAILKLPTGKTDNADKEYENNLCPLLASMLYPKLDFAVTQSRTDSGVLIRDLIFYNNISHKFLKEVYEEYKSRQLVFELKNVKEISSEHVNQLNRYLNNEFGSFGIIFTRNKPPKKVFRNTIDLWSGQRKCILILDDEDLQLMCQVYENKQRSPVDVINKKYVEFKRACPS